MAVDLTKPVLVVDDYVTMLRILRDFLRRLNFTDIHEPSDGAQALAELRSSPDFGLWRWTLGDGAIGGIHGRESIFRSILFIP